MADDLSGIALQAFSYGKKLYKQGKNAVLNVGDIEHKVKEATNRSPACPATAPVSQTTAKPRAALCRQLSSRGGNTRGFHTK